MAEKQVVVFFIGSTWWIWNWYKLNYYPFGDKLTTSGGKIKTAWPFAEVFFGSGGEFIEQNKRPKRRWLFSIHQKGLQGRQFLSYGRERGICCSAIHSLL
jgi:hypothetical protein